MVKACANFKYFNRNHSYEYHSVLAGKSRTGIQTKMVTPHVLPRKKFWVTPASFGDFKLFRWIPAEMKDSAGMSFLPLNPKWLLTEEKKRGKKREKKKKRERVKNECLTCPRCLIQMPNRGSCRERFEREKRVQRRR